MSIVLCEGKPGDGMQYYVSSHRWIVRAGKRTHYLTEVEHVRTVTLDCIERGERVEVERVKVGVRAGVAP